jgi:hypothetical protein
MLVKGIFALVVLQLFMFFKCAVPFNQAILANDYWNQLEYLYRLVGPIILPFNATAALLVPHDNSYKTFFYVTYK